jgi:hypothetical protein
MYEMCKLKIISHLLLVTGAMEKIMECREGVNPSAPPYFCIATVEGSLVNSNSIK